VVADAPPDWEPEADDQRPLLIPLVKDGIVQPGLTGEEGVRRAVDRHETSRAELGGFARRLSSGDPAIPTTQTRL
ncbi:MAG TPA: nicotinate phosphoribosyltransferase, partial [Ruania sp.]|nr:nicotinate phosphoribosyltransferase [Ruania sp.]